MPSNAGKKILSAAVGSEGKDGKRPRSPSPPATPPSKRGRNTNANGSSAAGPRRSKTPSPTRSSHSTEAKQEEITTKTVKSDAIPPQDDGKKTEASIWSQVEPFKRRTQESDFDPENMFKFITWNVAGLRGLLRKDSHAIQRLLEAEQPDALCLQETKLNPDDPQNVSLGTAPGYRFMDHPCRAKKGYSGTRTYIKDSIATVWNITSVKGFHTPHTAHVVGQTDGDDEGRVLTTYFGTDTTEANAFALALVNTYIPNSGMALERLPYRYQTFDQKVRQHLCALNNTCKPSTHTTTTTTGKATATANGDSHMPPLAGFIWTGDLNVAERDYDRYFAGTYKTMQKCSGFTPEERTSFRETLRLTNAVDTFRALYPRAAPVYTFWSARINGRARGLGWRLDYFVVSAVLASRVVDCFTMPQVMGSDHCPVQMWLRK